MLPSVGSALFMSLPTPARFVRTAFLRLFRKTTTMGTTVNGPFRYTQQIFSIVQHFLVAKCEALLYANEK